MKERDIRRYANQTQVRLVVGALLLLFIVGDGLIYVIYGQGAALMGLLCLGAGLLPVIAIGWPSSAFSTTGGSPASTPGKPSCRCRWSMAIQPPRTCGGR